MRQKVAKRLRKQAGKQTSTSNRMEYAALKKEHTAKNPVQPKVKISSRKLRTGGKVYITKTTVKGKR